MQTKSVFFLTILLSSLTTLVFGQTENHKPIAGTKYSLIPPAGFEAATKFSGFQNQSSGTSIMVTELPSPFKEISVAFSADALRRKGMSLISTEVISFNGATANYLQVSQPANGTTYFKQILVFGDDNKTVLVNGIYPEKSKNLEGEIKKSLLSTTYNELQKDNPLEAVKFKIDVANTEFKFTKLISGSLIYTIGGQLPTEKPTLLIGPSIGTVVAKDRKQYSIDRLKNLPGGGQFKLGEVNPVTIGELSGYEIVAKGKTKSGKDELVYQVVLFNGDTDYFILVGTASENLESILKAFRKVTATFQLKK